MAAVSRLVAARRHDRRHAAAYTEPSWTYEAGDAIESSAAIVDGVVYVGSQTGDLHAINLADGSLKWKYKASAGRHRRVVASGRRRPRLYWRFVGRRSMPSMLPAERPRGRSRPTAK